jgi:CubicO group peptidase (beta-lactamase class C family)
LFRVSPPSSAREWIGPLFEELVTRHGVVGASLAVLDGDDILTFASGTANTRTGQPVSPDTLFMVGSTTKSFTATLVLQLAEEGRVDLDLPVRRYVPRHRSTSRSPRPAGTLAPELVFDGFDAEGRPGYVYTAVSAARRVSPT